MKWMGYVMMLCYPNAKIMATSMGKMQLHHEHLGHGTVAYFRTDSNGTAQ